MPTKSEFGLGPLYHATTISNKNSILSNGLRSGSWLSYYRDEAYQTQIIDYGHTNIVTFQISLPPSWMLEKRSSTEYATIERIPPRYIRVLK